MNQYERTNNDDLPLLPVRLHTETCIFRRPHAPMLPEHEPRSLGLMVPFSRHKDNGLWSLDATSAISQVASKV